MYIPTEDKNWFVNKRDIPENCTVGDLLGENGIISNLDEKDNHYGYHDCDAVFCHWRDGTFLKKTYIDIVDTGERAGKYNTPVWKQVFKMEHDSQRELMSTLPVRGLFHRISKFHDPRNYLILIELTQDHITCCDDAFLLAVRRCGREAFYEVRNHLHELAIKDTYPEEEALRRIKQMKLDQIEAKEKALAEEKKRIINGG